MNPNPTEEDVLLVHSHYHLESVRRDESVFPMALLAAGAAIKASELAWSGEAAFALCRPPGTTPARIPAGVFAISIMSP